MKTKLFALLLCLCFAAAAMAKEIELPDSCGNPNTKFEVTTHKSTTALPAPDANKALVVFIEPNELPCLGCYTQRFAMDGQWVGATKKVSYFTLQVEPGIHHFCATGVMRNTIAIRSFEVKAGETYFLQARWISRESPLTEEEHDSQVVPGGKNALRYGMSLLDEEKGRYLVKSYEIAEFKKK
ncbi:MAG: hypothetical protein WB424_06045 [Terracidiphilus sp.]